MAEIEEPEAWFRVYEPPHDVISEEQEEAIRGYAAALGYPTLRGFHMKLRQWGWTYYDVLKKVSP